MPEFYPFPIVTLFAADSAGSLLPEALVSLVVGVSVFALARTVANTLHSEDLEQDAAWRYDVNRINELLPWNVADKLNPDAAPTPNV